VLLLLQLEEVLLAWVRFKILQRFFLWGHICSDRSVCYFQLNAGINTFVYWWISKLPKLCMKICNSCSNPKENLMLFSCEQYALFDVRILYTHFQLHAESHPAYHFTYVREVLMQVSWREMSTFHWRSRRNCTSMLINDMENVCMNLGCHFFHQGFVTSPSTDSFWCIILHLSLLCNIAIQYRNAKVCGLRW